jgi:hypothetical protein
MKTPWIKKFYNDKRDYIISEKQIEIPHQVIETQPPEYQLDKKYEVVLVQDVNDLTGQVSFFWLEESRNKIISPRFNNQQIAMMWIKENEK